MIISHKYRYVFVQPPKTGSTTIGRELRWLYDGEPILYKHSRYRDFWSGASDDERQYFVFSTIRNPLDSVVSQYVKYQTNHLGIFTDPAQRTTEGTDGYVTERHLERFRAVHDGGADFGAYLRTYFTKPYDDRNRLDRRRLDFVIRFESLNEDFTEVLRRLGIEQRRPLPEFNRTEGKESFLSYYTPDLQDHAVRVFGPYMRDWGYPLPREWDTRVSFATYLSYKTIGLVRAARWRWAARHPARPLF